MKKSELKQIIKEEITSVLKEEYDPNQDPEKKGSEAYKRAVWKGQFGSMDGFDKAYPQYSKGRNNVEGKFEIRGKDINNDGNLFYSLYLDGKQIGPNVIKNGGVTSGKDFEETLRKFIK